MNKKILIFGVLAALMLVAISFATAISSNTINTNKKESPLFGIRTRQAIKEKLTELKENIKTKFIGERVFFLPFGRLVNDGALSMRHRLGEKCALSWMPNCHGVMTYIFPGCTASYPTSC